MKFVNKFILLFIFTMTVVLPTWAQKGSERLRQEQDALLKRIETTKALLEKSQKDFSVSLEAVNLITQQLDARERLIQNIDNQIRTSELRIAEKEGKVKELSAEIDQLKEQYKDLLMLAYKRRGKYGDLMYLFNSKTLDEALKRKLYLEKFTEIQKKQLRLIQQNMELLDIEIKEIEKEKQNQLTLAEDKRKERTEIIKTKTEKERIYQQVKEQKEQLLKELEEHERTKERLKREIAVAIQREIMEERARQVRVFITSGQNNFNKGEYQKAINDFNAALKIEDDNVTAKRGIANAKAKIEEARKKAEEANKPLPPKPVETVSSEVNFPEFAESTRLGKDFSSNKGKLPFPVAKGTITGTYGRHQHPTLPNVYTQNNGIDISTVKNANVIAVFTGEVTSVISIPGSGQAVIIKHGNYRTVYSNLQEVYVTKGQKVETKTPIGSLVPSKNGNISIAHFEIHMVSGNGVEQLNPELWVIK